MRLTPLMRRRLAPPTGAVDLRRLVPAGHLTQSLRRVAPPPRRSKARIRRRSRRRVLTPVVLLIADSPRPVYTGENICRIALDVHPESCWSSHCPHSTSTPDLNKIIAKRLGIRANGERFWPAARCPDGTRSRGF
jgi:lambda repressor-like predicted transcriptional regulator